MSGGLAGFSPRAYTEWVPRKGTETGSSTHTHQKPATSEVRKREPILVFTDKTMSRWCWSPKKPSLITTCIFVLCRPKNQESARAVAPLGSLCLPLNVQGNAVVSSQTTRGTNPIGKFGRIGCGYGPPHVSRRNRLQKGLSSTDRVMAIEDSVTYSTHDREKQFAGTIV